MRRLVAPLAALTLGLSAGSALLVTATPKVAQAKQKPRIAVVADDKDAEALVADVVALIPSELKLADGDSLKGRLIKLGQKSSIATGLDKSRNAQLDRLRKGAHLEGADIVLVVTVKRDKKGRKASFLIVLDDDSETISEAQAALGAKKSKADADAISEVLTPQLEKLVPKKKAPPPETKESASVEPPPAPKTPPRPENVASRSLFSIRAGFEISGRNLSYNGATTPQSTMPEYAVSAAGGIAFAGDVYPAAGTDIPFLKDLGILGEYAQAIGLSSKQTTASGSTQSFDTSWNRWFVGGRGRLRLSGDDGVSLGLSLGYGTESFSISGPAAAGTLLPSATYGFFRIGADVLIPAGPVGISGGFAYRVTSGSGDIYSTGFQRSSVAGIDALLGLSLRVWNGFDLRVDGRYARYFASFSTAATDPYQASGAADGMWGVTLGVGYVY